MRSKRGMMPETIIKYCKWLMKTQESYIYSYLFRTISTCMDSVKKDSSLDPMKNGPSALVLISGDSLPAAAYRERANGEFPKDSFLLCCIYGRNIHKGFSDVIKLDYEPINEKAGWPMLVCWRGTAIIRYLDFQITPKAFDDFCESLGKDKDKVLRDVRDFMRIKFQT